MREETRQHEGTLSWELFQSTLIEHFYHIPSKERAASLLNKLQQDPHENIGEYVQRSSEIIQVHSGLYWCDNHQVQGCGIQPLVQYGKGCILGLLLFQSTQSTHDIFRRFPQWNYDYRKALHHQTDLHPNFLCLSLVLGCLQVGGSNCWDVLLIVVRRCHVHCC